MKLVNNIHKVPMFTNHFLSLWTCVLAIYHSSMTVVHIDRRNRFIFKMQWLFLRRHPQHVCKGGTPVLRLVALSTPRDGGPDPFRHCFAPTYPQTPYAPPYILAQASFASIPCSHPV